MISYVSTSGLNQGTVSFNVSVPTQAVNGDLLLLVISGRDSLPALPDGWTNIATVNNGTDIYNRTCYRFKADGITSVSIADSGVYTCAEMQVYANVDATNPINASGTNTSDGTAFSATGVTTTVNNCMIVHASAFQDAGTSSDATNHGVPTNANLAQLKERSDYYSRYAADVNAGIYTITGYKFTAGASGATTSTADSANNKGAVVTLALTPAAENLRSVYVGSNLQAYGAGNISVTVPTEYLEGDLLVMVLSGRDAVPALPDGWTNIDTHNNSTYTYNRTCYKIATSSESDVTITDSGVYTTGIMLLFRDVDETNPINASAKSTDSDTTFVAGGVTTTVDKCLVVHATSFTDSATTGDTTNFSSESNANLVALAERIDSLYYASAGVEAGIYVLTGTKLTAGATGDTSATADSASNYSATVTFAIAPPVEAAEVPEGGSESTVIVSVQGSGITIRQGGASASTIVSAQGAGIAIRLGSASSTVIVTPQGAGTKTASGGDESPVTVDAEGDGTKTSQSGASVTVIINSDGSGTKVASSGAESPLVVSGQGNGIKTGSGSSESIVVISTEGAGTVVDIISGGSESNVVIGTQGSGIKTTSDGSESPITISVQGVGNKIASSGSDSTVTIGVQGSGFRVMSGGSEANVIVSNDGSGVAIRFGGSNPTVLISSEGGGYGTLKTGGANSVVVIGIDGDGSKITSGSSDSTVIITAQGRGRTYKPIVITAVFNYEAEKTATFNCESEQTAIFNPAITIGGIYGDS